MQLDIKRIHKRYSEVKVKVGKMKGEKGLQP